MLSLCGESDEAMNTVVPVSYLQGLLFPAAPVFSIFKLKKPFLTVTIRYFAFGNWNCLSVSNILGNVSGLPPYPFALAEISDFKNPSSYLVSGVSGGYT